MKIAETLVFNEFKQHEYEWLCKERMSHTLFYKPEEKNAFPKATFSQMEIIIDILKLLQGIPSNHYLLDSKTLNFYLNPDISLENFGFSCKVSSFEQISLIFENAGT